VPGWGKGPVLDFKVGLDGVNIIFAEHGLMRCSEAAATWKLVV
jgi:hypothetical protein